LVCRTEADTTYILFYRNPKAQGRQRSSPARQPCAMQQFYILGLSGDFLKVKWLTIRLLVKRHNSGVYGIAKRINDIPTKAKEPIMNKSLVKD
jgi:hypothetical protein